MGGFDFFDFLQDILAFLFFFFGGGGGGSAA